MPTTRVQPVLASSDLTGKPEALSGNIDIQIIIFRDYQQIKRIRQILFLICKICRTCR